MGSIVLAVGFNFVGFNKKGSDILGQFFRRFLSAITQPVIGHSPKAVEPIKKMVTDFLREIGDAHLVVFSFDSASYVKHKVIITANKEIQQIVGTQ